MKILLILLLINQIIANPFKDNNDGTITDLTTSLIWLKCSKGQNNNQQCSGSAISETWKNALLHCKNLNQNSKVWRLPNIRELRSILDITTSAAPTINQTFFPNTLDYYWTSTTNIQNTSQAWYVGFDIGYSDTWSKLDTYYVRCVSGP